MNRVARRGPLARAPGALKGGHFRNCQHFCRSWRGDPLEKKQIFEKKSHNAEKLKGGPFGIFKHPICCKISKKLKGDPLEKKTNFRKKVSMPKNWKGGPFGVFQHPFCRKTAKKLKGDPLRKFFSEKKSRSAEKKWKGDPLVSPGMVCYARKQDKPFWFSSLDQIVQFGAIIFCRTFKNYFGQFVWIEKKATIIVAFHFLKRRLKNNTIDRNDCIQPECE